MGCGAAYVIADGASLSLGGEAGDDTTGAVTFEAQGGLSFTN